MGSNPTLSARSTQVSDLMNHLDFPIRLVERPEGDFCLMISHDPVDGFHKEKRQSSAKKTRSFCNWFRKQFPHIPNEFRYINTKRSKVSGTWYRPRFRTVNCDKHFVAYGVSKSDLMIIKLSWAFKVQLVRHVSDPPLTDAFTMNESLVPKPSKALSKKIENNTGFKSLTI